jgi:hypothetical protein
MDGQENNQKSEGQRHRPKDKRRTEAYRKAQNSIQSQARIAKMTHAERGDLEVNREKLIHQAQGVTRLREEFLDKRNAGERGSPHSKFRPQKETAHRETELADSALPIAREKSLITIDLTAKTPITQQITAQQRGFVFPASLVQGNWFHRSSPHLSATSPEK